ncbi:hypothetical protein R84981_002897 [Carnimonas sp. R-84981]|uniref:hypothetical protein n=1 Tax=Carnimonas bestiolae TaxID=3402172 RepID=UPI003EDB8FBF
MKNFIFIVSLLYSVNALASSNNQYQDPLVGRNIRVGLGLETVVGYESFSRDGVRIYFSLLFTDNEHKYVWPFPTKEAANINYYTVVNLNCGDRTYNSSEFKSTQGNIDPLRLQGYPQYSWNDISKVTDRDKFFVYKEDKSSALKLFQDACNYVE